MTKTTDRLLTVLYAPGNELLRCVAPRSRAIARLFVDDAELTGFNLWFAVHTMHWRGWVEISQRRRLRGVDAFIALTPKGVRKAKELT